MWQGARERVSDKVSIVVPTRNRRDILRHTLRSARAQTWPNIDIIVVDEASTDGTGRMLAAEFPNLKIVRHDVPHGPGGARNAGIAGQQQRLGAVSWTTTTCFTAIT